MQFPVALISVLAVDAAETKEETEESGADGGADAESGEEASADAESDVLRARAALHAEVARLSLLDSDSDETDVEEEAAEEAAEDAAFELRAQRLRDMFVQLDL